MALRKGRDNTRIRGLLTGSDMLQDACHDNGLNILARLIARRMLAGYSEHPREQGTTLCKSKRDRTVLEKERADE
jgi:hypothetical protein